MECIECGEELVACEDGSCSTLVGYGPSPPGHNHDDNCVKKGYWCKNEHYQIVSKRRICPHPDCDWAGKEECFCHPGKKVDEWPEVSEVRPPCWKRKELKGN